MFIVFQWFSPISTSFVFAAVDVPSEYTLLEPLPCVKSASSTLCEDGTVITKLNFEDYIKYIFNLFIAVSAVAAVLMIVWGGFQYMTSYSPMGKESGLEKAKNAIYGLLLVLSSYLILRTIDPRLVKIHPTLVPELNVPQNGKILSDFLNSLEDLDKINDARVRAAKQIEREQISKNTTERDELIKKISDMENNAELYPDGELEQLKIQLAEKDAEINKQKSDYDSSVIIENLNEYRHSAFMGDLKIDEVNSPWDYLLEKKLIEMKTYFEKKSRDFSEKNPTVSKTSLSDAYNYNEGMIRARLVEYYNIKKGYPARAYNYKQKVQENINFIQNDIQLKNNLQEYIDKIDPDNKIK
jgi:hypothetical protein